MIRFYVARQRFDAYLVADRLKQAGVRVHVFNQNASSIAGEVGLDANVTQPQVWLEREEDVDLARRVLLEMQAESRMRGTRHCAACGEDSPANFEICWNCGASV